MTRIDELLKMPRMGEGTDSTHSGNMLMGLLELIEENFNPDFEIVEIGSFQGVSTELFALKCKSVYSIDPYDYGEEFGQESRDQVKEAERIFVQKMKQYTNVDKIKAMSQNAVERFADNSLDAVYIDGDHRRNSVIQDIERWAPKIRDHGILAGHDYYEDIKDAVDCILGAPKKVYQDTSWLHIKGETW